MFRHWLESHTPLGFKSGCDRRQIWMVREDVEEVLSFERVTSGVGVSSTDLLGRQKITALPLMSGERALIRPYWHGGFFRHITRNCFFTWPPRPFKELIVSEHLRNKGVAVSEVLAAYVCKDGGPFYRGWLISREIVGAKSLWQVLQADKGYCGGKRQLWQDVASAIREMHDHGIFHDDLQLKNILVQQTAMGNRVYLIDFDKAKMFSAKISPTLIRRNFNRLLRSICKLDPYRRLLTYRDWREFGCFYYGENWS